MESKNVCNLLYGGETIKRFADKVFFYLRISNESMVNSARVLR